MYATLFCPFCHPTNWGFFLFCAKLNEHLKQTHLEHKVHCHFAKIFMSVVALFLVLYK